MTTKDNFKWYDPFLIEAQLTLEEKQVRDTAKQFAQSVLMPTVSQFFMEETFDPQIIKKMGEAGLLGASLQGYGCAGVSDVAYGLIAR